MVRHVHTYIFDANIVEVTASFERRKKIEKDGKMWTQIFIFSLFHKNVGSAFV